MNNRIRKYFCLFFVLAFFLVSCTQKSNDSASIKKMSGEMKFEAEITKLIQEGGDVNKVDERGIASLTWAVEFYYADAVKILLENGADPNTAPKKRSTDTALFATAKSLSFEDDPDDRETIRKTKIIAELLIKHGANVNHTDLLKNTPLHQAALGGRNDLCELFIQNGARVNATDKLGNIPLHIAAKEGYFEAAQTLLKNGASFNLKNRFGETALFLAKKRKEEPFNQEVRNRRKGFNPGSDYDRTIEILMEYGAK